MKVKKSVIAIIPARIGSKRIKKKNIKKFLNKPIILHTLKNLKNSNYFDLIVVSSDSKDVLEISKSGGANCFINRPKKLSNDFADTKSVIVHSILELEKKYILDKIFCIYPTSIFLKKKTIKKALDQQKLTKNFIFGAKEYEHPIERSFKKNKKKIKLNHPKKIFSRTQDLEKNYHDAAQFYLASKQTWLNSKSIINNNSSFIEISKFESQDIDTLNDWKFSELLYRNLHKLNHI